MLKYILLLLIVGAAIFLGPYLSDTQGLVHIVTGDYEVNTSLTTAIILLCLLFLVLWIVISLILKVLRFPKSTKRFFKRRGEKKALSLNSKAITAFEEGDYERTIQIVKELKRNHQITVEALFVGSRAAFLTDDYNLTRELLDEAQSMSPSAKIAASAIRARLNLRLNNVPAALEIINEIKRNASSKLITKLSYECYLLDKNYKELQSLLPQLLKFKLVDKEQARQISLSYINERLAKANSASEINKVYDTLNKADKRNPTVVSSIINKMVAVGDINHARKICFGLLKNNPGSEILEIISSWDISIPDVLKLLKSQASGNLIASQVNVPLLKAIANMELHEGLLKEAQEHYEKAFELNQSPDICLKLASIMSSQRYYDKATMYYEKALKLGAQEVPSLEHKAS